MDTVQNSVHKIISKIDQQMYANNSVKEKSF